MHGIGGRLELAFRPGPDAMQRREPANQLLPVSRPAVLRLHLSMDRLQMYGQCVATDRSIRSEFRALAQMPVIAARAHLQHFALIRDRTHTRRWRSIQTYFTLLRDVRRRLI